MRSLLFFIVASLFSITACTSDKATAKKSETEKVACFKVEGMTCATCSTTLKASVRKLKGINNVEASSDKGSAEVSYEPSIVNASAIKGSIDSVGYKATERACSKSES